MKRIKVKLPTITSRDDAEALVGEINLITLNQIRLTARMDQEIAAVRQRYEANLAAMSEGLKQKADTLRAWAEANPDQFPKDRKSIEFIHGKLGFRTGTPKLALLSRSWTWDLVRSLLKAYAGGCYVRTKEDVDKELILSSYAGDALDDATLRKIGLKVVQEEAFFVEPKLTEVETRHVTEAAA